MTTLTPVSGDNYPQVQAALNGGDPSVYLRYGNWGFSQQPVVPAGSTLYGDGVGTVMMPLQPMSEVVSLNGDHARLCNVQLLQASGYASAGVAIQTSQFTEVDGVYGANLPIGIQNINGQAYRINKPTLIGCGFGIFSSNDGRNSSILDPFIQGGTCIWIDKQTQQCEGLDIKGGKLLPSVQSGASLSGTGLVLAQSFLEISVIGTIIDQIPKFGVQVVGTNGGGTYMGLKMTDVWMGAQPGVIGSMGAQFLGPLSRVSMKGCTITGAQGYGVDIDNQGSGNSSGFDIDGNFFFSNASGDLRVNGLLWSVIAKNQFNSSYSSIEDETSNNEWLDNVYTTPPVTRSSSSHYWYRGSSF